MSKDYQINTSESKAVFAYDTVFVDFTSTKPIAGGPLGATYVFFYKVNPPVTWDDISASVKEAELISFTQTN